MRVNLREIVRGRRRRRRSFYHPRYVPCNILQMSLGAHATDSRPCADHKNRRLRPHRCFFFLSLVDVLFLLLFVARAERISTCVNFLGETRKVDIGTRSFYSAINFIPGANVTRYRGFCKYYRARSLQARNIDCNVMRTWAGERVDFRWKITSLVWLPPHISRVVKGKAE